MSKFALISVSDKKGLLPFVEELVKHYGYHLLSTGGTYKLINNKGLKVTEVSTHTGFPDFLSFKTR